MRTQGVLIGHRDPITGLRDIWELDCSSTLQQNIELRYPDGLNHETVTLSINGQVVDPLTCAELDRRATAFDRVDLVFRQQGIDPITAIVIAVIAVAAAVAVTLLMPKPQIPNNIGTRKDSPNNSLTGQTNIARAYQAIPDIYGKVRAYPDLIQPSVEEYISNIKYVTEWMALGIGSYLVENQRFADTPLSAIPGSSSAVYQPNQTVPLIFESFPSPEVDGQELLGINEDDHGWQGAFNSQVDADQIWFNIVFLRGLKATAEFTAEWWAIDANGVEVSGSRESDDTISFTGTTLDAQYHTIKRTPAFGRARYAFRLQRTNNASTNANNPDQAKLEEVFFIRRVVNKNFGNVTIYNVTTKATEQATGIRDRQFNVDATRRTITRNSNTLTANRSFANAILHEFEVVAGRDRSELDLDGLYAISDSLDDRLGYFDFTFDDKDISLGNRIQTMCNAARVAVYRDGQLWRFVRDERRAFPSMQLDRRTLKEGSDYQVQIKGHLPSSFDGVKLEYVDPVKNRKAYINLKIDNTTGQITEQASANPYELQLAGCRDPFQAMNRAQLEARKIIYQRTTVKDTVLGDPFNQATFGSMIKWVDSYDVAVNDGEILSVEAVPGGYRFMTSEPVVFEEGKSYRVTVTDEVGQVSEPAVCVPRPDGKFGFDANVTGWYVADDGIKQLGSRYLVTTEEEQEAAKFIVSGRTPTEEGDVQIELVEYDDRMYEYDAASLPADGFILLESGDHLLKEDFNRLEI